MDPATMTMLLRAAADAKRTIDAVTLRRTVESIRTAVDSIGMQLAEAVLVEVRSGFDHLAVAVEVANDDDLRRDELRLAREYFGRLANRPGGGMVVGISGALSGDQVAALGHLGNYHYFLIQGQERQALIAAYLCTERFPALGVQLYPPQLFSRDYRAAVARSDAREESLRREHDIRSSRWRRYRLDMAWRVPAAGGALIAGLLGAAVSPPLAGHGVQWAHGILAGAEEGVLPPPRPSDRGLRAHAVDVERLLAPVRAEARERRAAIEATGTRER